MSEQPEGKKDMNENLPGCSREFVQSRIGLVPEKRMDNMVRLLNEVGDGDFWEKKRFVKIIRLLDGMGFFQVAKCDIAAVLDVSCSLVTRIKQYHRHHPEEVRPSSGRPSPLSEVFPLVENLTDEKTAANQAVTMGILMSFVTDELTIEVSRQALWRYMHDHGFAYETATPRDHLRVITREEDIATFYQNLEEDVQGVHPSLMFNVDEMGAELFADSKDVMVFVRPRNIPVNGHIYVGVGRSSRRCTLVACIGLDGDTLIPTVLTKTKRSIRTSLTAGIP